MKEKNDLFFPTHDCTFYELQKSQYFQGFEGSLRAWRIFYKVFRIIFFIFHNNLHAFYSGKFSLPYSAKYNLRHRTIEYIKKRCVIFLRNAVPWQSPRFTPKHRLPQEKDPRINNQNRKKQEKILPNINLKGDNIMAITEKDFEEKAKAFKEDWQEGWYVKDQEPSAMRSLAIPQAASGGRKAMQRAGG